MLDQISMHFLTQLIIINHFATETEAVSSAVRKFLWSGTGMKDADTRKNMIFRVFSTKHEILRLFQKKCSGATRSSHQLLVNRTLIQFFIQFIILNIFAEDTEALSPAVLKFWGSGTGMKMQKHTKTCKNMIFWFFSTNHEILRLFQKKKNKRSGATRSSHQLLINIYKVFSLPFSTFLLKTPKLYLHPISQF